MAVLPRKPPVDLRPSNRSLRGAVFLWERFGPRGRRAKRFLPRDGFALKRSSPDGPVLKLNCRPAEALPGAAEKYRWPGRGKSFIRPKRCPVEGSCSARSALFWRLESKRSPSFQTLEPTGPSALAQGGALRWDEPPASTAVFRKLAPKRFRRVPTQTHEALRSGNPDDWAVARSKRSAPLFHADSGVKRFPEGHFLGGQRAPAVWLQGSASFDLSHRRAALHATGWFCVFILSKSLLLLLPATARASCSAQDVLPTPPGAISAPTVFGKKPGKIYRWELAFPVRKPP